ncbi:MAG: hypothetical protein JWN84_1861 [Nocardioides sp.]|nr:hypothetical protein [Nocardioides sp.]
MSHRPARSRALVALVASAALTTSLLATYAAPSATGLSAAARPDAGDRVATASRAERQAVSAVARARGVVSGEQPGDLTMALREVANTRSALTGADRRAADGLLARPTDPGGDPPLDYAVPEATPVCSADVCVHYVAAGPDAATPAYVDTVLATLTAVHDRYRAAGYREPRPDGKRGGNAKIDVYLGQLGDQGLYGYCTSDEPETSANSRTYDRWAYCALDNDYAEFPTNTPLENLQVTVAHEYFHATQYAYDRYEDAWLLEATAAWVEDEVYDGVDDNLQYLRSSQLAQPRVPLDTFNGATGFHYGTWSYVRYLTETFPARKGGLPRLVLDLFTKADGARGGPDQYSWQALDSVLRARGTSAAKMLGRYAVANRRPAQSYAEGRANRYPTAPLLQARRVGAGQTKAGSVRLKHLTTATVRLTPQALRQRGWRLRLALDLPPAVRGASALVTSATPGGRVTTRTVRTDKQGDAVVRVPFSSRKVAWVELTLVNGSGRFTCFTRGAFSCQGTPVDNALRLQFAATAVR